MTQENVDVKGFLCDSWDTSKNQEKMILGCVPKIISNYHFLLFVFEIHLKSNKRRIK